MPSDPNYKKSNRLDKLYEENPNGYRFYEDLRADLATINSSIMNEEANISLNNNYDSYISDERKLNDLANIPKRYNKKRLYGIVVGNSANIGKNVYVDVPLQNINVIKDDLIFLDPDIDLSQYQELIFFPMINSLQKEPQQGTICIVEIPENYPNHIDFNHEDAVFIDIYRKEILAPAGTSRPQARVVPGSLQDQIDQLKRGNYGGYYSGGAYGGFGGEAALVKRQYLQQAQDNWEDCINPSAEGYDRLQKLLTRKPNELQYAIKQFADIYARINQQELEWANEASAYYGIDPYALITLGGVETSWAASYRVSGAGARGRYQVMPVAMEDTMLGGLPKAQGWLSKFTDLEDSTVSGGSTKVKVVIQSGKNLIVNPAFVIAGHPHALRLEEPLYWHMSAYYGARALQQSIELAGKRFSGLSAKDVAILVTGGYNYGPQMINIQKKRGYENVATWDISPGGGKDYSFPDETCNYMIRAYVWYSLLKCALALQEKAGDKPATSTPTSTDKTVLLLGNSHSAWEFGNNFVKLLEGAGYKVTRIAAPGMSAGDYVSPSNVFGSATQKKFKEKMDEFRSQASSKKDWGMCIVELGTNDVSIKVPNYSQTVGELKQIFDSVTAGKKFWISPPKVNETASSKGEYTAESVRKNGKKPLNTRVQELVSAYESNKISGVTRIDSFFAGAFHSGKSGDKSDIHFYGEDAKKWAEGVFSQIKGTGI